MWVPRAQTQVVRLGKHLYLSPHWPVTGDYIKMFGNRSALVLGRDLLQPCLPLEARCCLYLSLCYLSAWKKYPGEPQIFKRAKGLVQNSYSLEWSLESALQMGYRRLGRDKLISTVCGPQVPREGALGTGKWELAAHLYHMVHMLPVYRGEDGFLALESRRQRLFCPPGSWRPFQAVTSPPLDYLGWWGNAGARAQLSH